MLFNQRIFYKRTNIILNKKENKFTPSEYASRNGHLDVVKYLHSINIPNNEWAIAFASVNGHLDVVKYLYSINAPVNEGAIKYASMFRHLNIVKFLKEQYPQFQ
jgi:ankyrin repeat protein